MRNQMLMRTALTAAMVAFAGGAMAAGDKAQSMNKTQTMKMSAEQQAEMAPVSAVGKYVVNDEGQPLGRVIGVLNNRLFVETDQRLGMGSQPRIVEWHRFKETDHEGTPALSVSMSEAEWKSNPVYAIPEGESQMDSDRSVGPREPKRGSTRGFVPPAN